MMSFAQFGNDLYTGKRSMNIVGRQKLFYAVSGVILVLAAIGIFGTGLNFGLEFRGGSELRVSGLSTTQNFEAKAKEAMSEATGGAENLVVTTIGSDTIRIQTEKLNETQTNAAQRTLAKDFGVPESQVSANFIGASWGKDVTNKAISALIWFLVLVSIVLGIYFRTWKMALSALVALLHDLIITVGIYALFKFEITPASMIGFLTILGYSLYDTVVVFDKVRENTRAAQASGRQTYSQAANMAVNQTLVRSINTSVVALLPVGAILVIGFTYLGPGTLLDLSLALFVGIAAGTYSSVFIATPLLADLREREPGMKDLAKRARKYQEKLAHGRRVSDTGLVLDDDGNVSTDSGGAGQAPPAAASSPADAQPAEATSGVNGEEAAQSSDEVPHGGRQLHPYARTGPRGQPKRSSKSRR
ncbi:protein translocase subunit SecF [Segeticoccus rhizosphaerae]|uniref:protein translocase subunit SecF n=1 Tax=Segeticoccus rhizosphaerae TaxID=1104777 RepID=UPI001264FF36|nr:protein translocase subunit SecF [Segeticoccus rhizosphaerae]